MLAGLSQGPTHLMACRVGQAVGAALMMTNTFALTGSLFTGPDRGRAMGLSGGLVSAIGFTLGPVVGGFITYTLGWRYIFFISGALSFIGLAAARFLLLDDRGSGTQTRREPLRLRRIRAVRRCPDVPVAWHYARRTRLLGLRTERPLHGLFHPAGKPPAPTPSSISGCSGSCPSPRGTSRACPPSCP